MAGSDLNSNDLTSQISKGTDRPEPIIQSPSQAKISVIKLALIAMGIPALICLLAIQKWRYRMISADTWFLAGNYMDASQSGSWLSALFTRLNDHWLVPCKAGLFAAFQWFGRDVDALSFLSWFSALIIATWVAKESYSWMAERPRGQLIGVWLVVALFVFTLGQTYFLLWEACFFLHFPLIALLVMIEVFRSNLHWLSRILLASIAGAGSVLSFGMGIVAVIAVFPSIWLSGKPDRAKTIVAWIVSIGLLTALQFSGVKNASAESTTVQRIVSDPWQAVEFVLVLLGSPLAWGTAIDPIRQGIFFGFMGIGILALLMLGLWQKRATPDLCARAAPWISISLAGLGAALLITAGRVSDNLGFPLTGRYVALALPFLLGIYLLAALLWGKKRGFGRVTILLAILLSLNWYAGALEMPYWHAKNRSEMASLALLSHLPIEALPGLDLVEPTERIRETAKFLRSRGALRGVTDAPGVETTDYRVRSELTRSRAEFRTLQAVEGGLLANGRALQPETILPPDLILIAFETEGEPIRIIDTALPNLPISYFENKTRLRTYRDFYQGWQRIISPARLPPGKSGWIRAYTWDCNTTRLSPMIGKHWIDATSTRRPPALTPP
jgi:hypothetical protein